MNKTEANETLKSEDDMTQLYVAHNRSEAAQIMKTRNWSYNQGVSRGHWFIYNQANLVLSSGRTLVQAVNRAIAFTDSPKQEI